MSNQDVEVTHHATVHGIWKELKVLVRMQYSCIKGQCMHLA